MFGPGEDNSGRDGSAVREHSVGSGCPLGRAGLSRRCGEMSPYLGGIGPRGEDVLLKWLIENDLWRDDARRHAGRVRDISLEIETQHLV